MNVVTRKENSGTVVSVKPPFSAGNAAPIKYADNAIERSATDDDDFMAMMNESKSKDESSILNSLPVNTEHRNADRMGFGGHDSRNASDIGLGADVRTNSDRDRSPISSYRESSSGREPDAFENGTPRFKSLEEEKQDYLHKIQRLQSRYPGRRVGIETSLEELKYEYERLRRQSDMSASLKFQRRTLMAAVSGVEYMNKKFNPLGLQLDGWSEQMMDSLEDFDQTFEQLHDKYKGSSEISPEWNLLIMVLGSGFMFHLSNSLFKSVLPNVSDVAKNNPDLMQQIATAMGSAMGNRGGEANTSKVGGEGGVRAGDARPGDARPGARPDARPSTSEMGASLAFQAMQHKLNSSEQSRDDMISELSGFEQASMLKQHQSPVLEQSVPLNTLQDMLSESDLSSDMSLESDALAEEDDEDLRMVRPVTRGVKRAPTSSASKQKKTAKKRSVNIKI